MTGQRHQKPGQKPGQEPDQEPDAPVRADEHRVEEHRAAGVVQATLGLVLIGGVAFLAGLVEVLLVPLRIGTVIIPVTVLLAVATTIGLPILARAVVPSTAAAALPTAVWLVTVVWLVMSPRAEGDVLVRAGGSEQWVFYGLLLVGTLAGTVAVVLTMPRPGRVAAAVAPTARPRPSNR